MTKPELIEYIANRFSADPEYPWEDDQVDCVFRHGNKKNGLLCIWRLSGSASGWRALDWHPSLM